MAAGVFADATSRNQTVVYLTNGLANVGRNILRTNGSETALATGRTLDADSNVIVSGTTDVCDGSTPFILTGEYDHANGDCFISVGSAAAEGTNTSWHTPGNTSATDSIAMRFGRVALSTDHLGGRIYQILIIARQLTAGEKPISDLFCDKIGSNMVMAPPFHHIWISKQKTTV